MNDADQAAPHNAGLLIRIWVEPTMPDLVRARFLSFHQQDPPTNWATAAGEDALISAFTRWLHEEVGCRGEHVPPGSTPDQA